MKRLTLLLALCALMVTFSVPASADDINFAGSVTMTQVGSSSSPAVSFTFSGLTVNSMGGDALEGTSVSLTGSFVFSSISGSNGYFSPNSGTLTIGNATTGTLTGDINFVTITSNNTGGYSISVHLSNVAVTTGSSAYLSSLGSLSGDGSGIFTFQFVSGCSSCGLSDLLNMGFSGGMANTSTKSTSVSASVAVPEPASLFLLGSGLLAGGGFVRRKLQR